MKSTVPGYNHIEGKTYTLFGDSVSTSEYYETIRNLADKVAYIVPDTKTLLETISKYSNGKRALKRALKKEGKGSQMDEILNLIDPFLRKYTVSTDEHLKHIPLSKILDRRIATSREQYHLYMLEAELTNRLNDKEFRKASRKIALLPYCLQDFTVTCKSEKAGFDYQCRNCSAGCYQNHTSKILRNNNIEPFIWQTGSLKQLIRETAGENVSFGVLGIACLPELINGMRDCRKYSIPVVGLPLNANRCTRWFGKFLPNSVDLAELEKLVSTDQIHGKEDICKPLSLNKK